ncbi:MAG TPA: STAS domain-containing protein [Verrucomicrobiae bacterium]|jgi:anti-anti-sigma regulatory factor
MFLATTNKTKQLLYLSYIGKVSEGDLQSNAPDLAAMLAELSPGFRVLADLSQMESMDTACVPEIGRTMELLEQRGVGLVVRIIPDPSKDIGMNIISAFHYKNRPQTATCETMAAAAELLSL